MSKITFNYFSKEESELFNFVMVPKELFKNPVFKELSIQAKMLYGFLLDRNSLSKDNGWYDENGNVYIYYAVEEIMNDMNCSKPSAIKYMKELIEIGLVEKKRLGLGSVDVIYVKNFIIKDSVDMEEEEESGEFTSVKEDATTPEKEEHTAENGDIFKKSKTFTSASKSVEPPEVKNFYHKKSKTFTSGSKKHLPLEVKNFYPNNTDINNTYQSKTEENDTESIYQSRKDGWIDEHTLLSNLGYYGNQVDSLSNEEKELYEGIAMLICDVVLNCHEKTIGLTRGRLSTQAIKERFMKLRFEHIKYVIDSMKKSNTHVTNPRTYLITSLYNSVPTLNSNNMLNAAVENKKVTFNSFGQRDYDFSELERKLLEK